MYVVLAGAPLIDGRPAAGATPAPTATTTCKGQPDDTDRRIRVVAKDVLADNGLE